MITEETLAAETEQIFMKAVKDEYMEAADYLASFLDDGDWPDRVGPFEIASNLLACDKPRRFPEYLVNYITDLCGMEIAAGNPHAMNDLGALY